MTEAGDPPTHTREEQRLSSGINRNTAVSLGVFVSVLVAAIGGARWMTEMELHMSYQTARFSKLEEKLTTIQDTIEDRRALTWTLADMRRDRAAAQEAIKLWTLHLEQALGVEIELLNLPTPTK